MPPKSVLVKKKCVICTKSFYVKPSHAFIRKSCSWECAKEIHRKRMMGNRFFPLRRMDKNPRWTGDNITYAGLHNTIRSRFGKPAKCDLCGLDKQPPEFRLNYFQWSNKTGVYNRHRKNWWMLCTKCHKNYDLKRTKYGKENSLRK